ncbi:MAG: glycosyltransferase [Planctomycetota bacterium]
MEPLSLLLLNPHGEEGWGGVETWMLAVARGLAREGHRVAACARPASRLLSRLAADGFETEVLALRRDLGPIDVLRLRRILRRRAVDVVVTKLDRGIRTAGLASRLGGRAAVVQRQGLFEVKEGFRHRFAFRWVDRIITPSRAVLGRIAASGAVPEDRVDHVPNGVDAGLFGNDPARGNAFREERGLPPGPLLVTTSRLHDQKGHDLMIRALAALPDAQLAVAGRGKREPEIRELAREVGVAARVHFLGHVDDVPALLSAADLFVLASRFEGMPNNVLEAMAAGLPIVATAVGDVPLMLEDGVSGLLVPPEDPGALSGALARLLSDPGLARALGEAARRRARERYTVEAMVTATEASLRRAVEERVCGRTSS